MDRSTHLWWTALRGIALFNVALLAFTALSAPSRPAQLLCAAIYVVVCAFRSLLPRVDLERIVLVDHWLPSIAIGRTAATIAELAFTVQCALFVDKLADQSDLPVLHVVASSLVPLIAAAQVCCWLGVLTLRHGWHAAEEALWALVMGLIAAAFSAAWPAVASMRPLLALGIVACAGGALVMVALDIPMYLRRSREERASGRAFLSVPEGILDALRRRHPEGSWDLWRREVLWMTPYFSAGVWLSIALVWVG